MADTRGPERMSAVRRAGAEVVLESLPKESEVRGL